jgi:hypothetical protein
MGTVDYSLTHGGFLPHVDLGILAARRLDDLPPWHNIFDAVKDILLQYVSEHDTDGTALRSAARSIVLDAAGAEDELSPEARAVLDEAKAVLDEARAVLGDLLRQRYHLGKQLLAAEFLEERQEPPRGA